MLLDEFVDFRVRAGESGRQEVERERARRADERGRWLRGMLGAGRAAGRGDAVVAAGAAAAGAAAAGAASAVPAAAAAMPATSAAAVGPSAIGAAEPAPAPDRELAHAAR